MLMKTLKAILNALAIGLTAVLVIFDPWCWVAWLLAGAFGWKREDD
jgi:hypothetical protein